MQVLGWDVGISLFPSVSKPLGYFQVMLFKNSFIIKRVRHLLYQQISRFLHAIWTGSKILPGMPPGLAAQEEKWLRALLIRRRCALRFEGQFARGGLADSNQEYYAWILCYMQEKAVRRWPWNCTVFLWTGKGLSWHTTEYHHLTTNP